MAPKATIRMEQLTRAKKLLHDLPKKDDGKTRPEAAEFLEADFRKAFKKGYSPKELSQMLKNERIIIPAYLIQKFLSETMDTAPIPKASAIPVQKKDVISVSKKDKASPKTPRPEKKILTESGLPDKEL